MAAILRFQTYKNVKNIDEDGNETYSLKQTHIYDKEFPELDLTENFKSFGFNGGSEVFRPEDPHHWDLGSAGVYDEKQGIMLHARKKEGEGVISADLYNLKLCEDKWDRTLAYPSRNDYYGHKTPLAEADLITVDISNNKEQFTRIGYLEVTQIPSDSEESFIPVSYDEVFSAFKEMQKAQNEVISDHWVAHAQKSKWYKGKVNPSELIMPYSEFRKLVYFSKRGLTNKEAFKEILESKNEEAINLITGPLNNPPPIIALQGPDGRFYLDDGCKRSLTACNLGLSEIDAFIMIPKMPEQLDEWLAKPKHKPESQK